MVGKSIFSVKSSFVLSTTHFSLKTTAILQSSCSNSLIMLKPDDILSFGGEIDFPTMVLLFLLDVDGPLFIVLIGIYVISVSQNEVGVSLFHWVWSETAVHFSPVLNTLKFDPRGKTPCNMPAR